MANHNVSETIEYRNPSELVIDGLDNKEGPDSPYWCHRATKTLDKGLLQSVKAKGIEQPIAVQDVDGQLKVTDGRQRVKAARELKLKTVPVFKASGDALHLQFSMNHQRVDDKPSETAFAVSRFWESMGGVTKSKMAKAQLAFKLDDNKVKALLALGECGPLVQRKVDEGKIPISAAQYLKGVDDAKVQAALDELSPGQTMSVATAKKVGEYKPKKKAKKTQFNPLAKNNLVRAGRALYMRDKDLASEELSDALANLVAAADAAIPDSHDLTIGEAVVYAIGWAGGFDLSLNDGPLTKALEALAEFKITPKDLVEAETEPEADAAE